MTYDTAGFFLIGYFFFGDSCSWVTFVLLLSQYLFDVSDWALLNAIDLVNLVHVDGQNSARVDVIRHRFISLGFIRQPKASGPFHFSGFLITTIQAFRINFWALRQNSWNLFTFYSLAVLGTATNQITLLHLDRLEIPIIWVILVNHVYLGKFLSSWSHLSTTKTVLSGGETLERTTCFSRFRVGAKFTPHPSRWWSRGCGEWWGSQLGNPWFFKGRQPRFSFHSTWGTS